MSANNASQEHKSAEQALPPGTTIIFPANADPLSFITLNGDNTVTVISKHMEMGQGIYTGLATLVAEEMDAAREQIRVVAAPLGQQYGNVVMGGIQGTGGQTSMQASYLVMRKAGAGMRQMILAAAAQRWATEAATLTISGGVVSDAVGGRSATFGELAQVAMTMTAPTDVSLKEPSTFAHIGKPFARLDSGDKIRGKAIFTQDLKLPNMLTAVIARPSRAGARVVRFNATQALAFPGVRHVVQVDAGIAVVADDFWTALQGRERLNIEWDLSQAFRKSSVDIYRELAALTASDQGTVALNTGDVDAALAQATTRISASFQVPHHTHAPMETMNIIIQLKDGKLHAWGGLQLASMDQYLLSQAAGLTPDKVVINMQMTGGSFGRRASPHSVPGIETISIIKAIKTDQPIKLMYDRSDDMSGPQNYYRPAFVHRIEAGMDASGRVTAWRHRLAGQSIAANTMMERGMVHDGVDSFSVEGGVDQPYNLPNRRMELHTPSYPIRASWMRTSGVFHNSFAIESMMDQLAHAVSKDPVEFRRSMLPQDSRERGCLDLVAAKANWFTPMAPDVQGRIRGRGVAVTPSHRSFAAVVVEITLATDGKGYSIDRVVSVMDCGVVINPNNVISQMEGSVGFALSMCRFGQITFTDGEVDQKFFSDYHVTRMHTMPAVESYIVPSTQGPSGASETVASAVAPALANALFMATGQPHTTMPLTLADEILEPWAVPAGLNTFKGATEWNTPEGWLPISSRE